MKERLPKAPSPVPGGGGEPLPPPRGPMIEVLRPQWEHPVKGLILQDKLSYVAVHFLDERTQECVASRAQCEGCLRGLKKEGRGYLLVLTEGVARLAIAELTDYAICYCPPLYAGNLAGRRLRVRRLRPSRRSKTACEVGEAVESLPPGWTPIDPLEVMRRMWSAPNRTRSSRLDEDGNLIPI